MDFRDACEVIWCLPRERTLFHYFKDRYALFLLGKVAGDGRRVCELKQSHYGKLLQKPIVREVTARASSGVLDAASLESIWPDRYETYRLTLGLWGKKKYWRDHQISRPGTNLVLQLNFSEKFNREYEKSLRAEGYDWFGMSFHPVARKGFYTMAWSRMDVDLNRGEALIEEIQNDWLRDVEWFHDQMVCFKDLRKKERWVKRCFGEDVKSHQVERYLKHVIEANQEIWDEAMLTASLFFLREELGIRKIFYHSFETGVKLKGIDGLPPRSIYTKLPRQFCFESCQEGPSFIESSRCHRTRKVLKDAGRQWFRMEL